jgi:hypothetical protein
LLIDFVTGLPLSWFRNEEVDAILVIVNRFTKYTFFLTVRTDIDLVTFTLLFYNEIELVFRSLRGIVLDRGSIFTSAFWKELYISISIWRRLLTAFYP